MLNIKEYRNLIYSYEDKIKEAKRKNDFDTLCFYQDKIKRMKRLYRNLEVKVV